MKAPDYDRGVGIIAIAIVAVVVLVPVALYLLMTLGCVLTGSCP
ncbi:hypothetical protein [Erythrobacter colymbi]|nr:hypothetical protein [Erythrobacter colymbi]